MTDVQPGRFTNAPVDAAAVFLIGMRFNRIHRPDRWGPVVMAMPPMLRHLSAHPEVGMLSFDLWFGRTTLALTYWRSAEALQTFAADPQAPHLQPWRDYVRRIGSDGSVGVWHETYRIERGSYETVYVNMPPFGLGRAVGSRTVGSGLRTARQRMGAAAG